MSKADKLLKALFNGKVAKTDKENKNYMSTEEQKAIILQHFKDIHDEAVAATVMAYNKQNFVKPVFKP